VRVEVARDVFLVSGFWFLVSREYRMEATGSSDGFRWPEATTRLPPPWLKGAILGFLEKRETRDEKPETLSVLQRQSRFHPGGFALLKDRKIAVAVLD
jgi:hypothetical protein